MLSVVSTDASPSMPAICIASLATTRGAPRRSLVLVMTLPPTRPGGRPNSATPAFATSANLTPQTLRTFRPSLRARPDPQLNLPSFQIRACNHDVHRVPQPEAVPGPLGPEGKPVFGERQRRIADRPLRQKPLDVPTFQNDEQTTRRERHDR